MSLMTRLDDIAARVVLLHQELSALTQEMGAIRLLLEQEAVAGLEEAEEAAEVPHAEVSAEWHAAYRNLRATLDHDWMMTSDQADAIHAELRDAHSVTSLKELEAARIASIAAAYREAAHLKSLVTASQADGAALINALLAIKGRTRVWEIPSQDWAKGVSAAAKKHPLERRRWAGELIAKGNG